MINEMLNRTQYELLHYPHYGAGKYLGQPFSALFSKNHKRLSKITFGNGLLAKAMMDYYRKNVNTEEAREIMEVVRRYYDKWINRGCHIYTLDEAFVGVALIDVYEITKNKKYLRGIEAIMSFLTHYDTDQSGSFILHRDNKEKHIYVDTIGYVCPFLAKYAKTFDDSNAMAMAVTQITNFLQFGMDDRLILPYHGYDSDSGVKYGIIGWGLAVGRLMMGMSETLSYMDTANPGYEIIRQGYRRIVDKVESYQTEGGLYTWQLSAKDGPADTAASALILYSIARSLEDKVLIGIHRSRMQRGADALKLFVQEDGSIPGASADTDTFNEYPIDFGDYPWALAPALSLFVLLGEKAVPENSDMEETEEVNIKSETASKVPDDFDDDFAPDRTLFDEYDPDYED